MGRPKKHSETPSLTYKQRLFVSAYLGQANGNAAEAARIAGYAWPDKQGPQQLAKTSVRVAVDAKLASASLAADEVLARISEMASADIGEFVTLTKSGIPTIDLRQAKAAGKLHLIRKIKPTQFGMVIELHDPQSALDKLARYHGLYKDQVNIDPNEIPKRIVIPGADQPSEDE